MKALVLSSLLSVFATNALAAPSLGVAIDKVSLNKQQQTVETRIDRDRRTEKITAAQAAAFQTGLTNNRALEAKYGKDGLTAREITELSNQLNELAKHIPR